MTILEWRQRKYDRHTCHLLNEGMYSMRGQGGDLTEAQRLNEQFLQHYKTGQYQQAIPLAQRELAICEKALGPEHPETAVVLNNLAEAYHATGAYPNA